MHKISHLSQGAICSEHKSIMPIFQSKKGYASPKVNSVPHVRAFVLQITTWSEVQYQKQTDLEGQSNRPASVL